MKTYTVVATVFVGACISAPVSYVGLASPAREATFDCAVAQLTAMNYTIEDADDGAGFVRGRRPSRNYRNTRDMYLLTVQVSRNPGTDDTTLRVEAARRDRRGYLDSPSRTAVAEGRSLLSNCGVSEVTPDSSSGEAHGLEGPVKHD